MPDPSTLVRAVWHGTEPPTILHHGDLTFIPDGEGQIIFEVRDPDGKWRPVDEPLKSVKPVVDPMARAWIDGEIDTEQYLDEVRRRARQGPEF